MAEKAINTGGPAFPCHPEIIPHKDQDFSGMALRDYFAATAMTACYAEYCAHANVQGYEEDWKMGVALDSYAMADAMLKARDRGVGQSENDRRVAACLDALKHVSTEDLESGRVQSIGLRLFDAEKQRDELREALEGMFAAWGSGFDEGESPSLDKARAAIAKATGEPQ